MSKQNNILLLAWYESYLRKTNVKDFKFEVHDYLHKKLKMLNMDSKL